MAPSHSRQRDHELSAQSQSRLTEYGQGLAGGAGETHLAVVVECFGHCAREQLSERAERRGVQEEHLLSNEDIDAVFSLGSEERRELHEDPHQNHLDKRGGVAG